MATALDKVKIALNELRGRHPDLFEEEIKFIVDQGYADIAEFYRTYFHKKFKAYCKGKPVSYNGDRTCDNIVTYVHNNNSKDVMELVEHLLAKNATDYWSARSSYISTDQRERRFIMTLPTVDEIAKREVNNREIDAFFERSLGERKGLAIDLLKKKLVTSPDICTVYDDGHSIKGQEPFGVHFIVPRGKTMRYCPETDAVTFVNTIDAQSTDDANPSKYYFVNGSATKSSGFLYSLHKCQKFYDYVSSMYP